MMRLASLFVAIMIFAACDSEPRRTFVPIVTTRPSPVSQVDPGIETVPFVPSYREITVGGEFRDNFIGNPLTYQERHAGRKAVLGREPDRHESDDYSWRPAVSGFRSRAAVPRGPAGGVGWAEISRKNRRGLVPLGLLLL